MMATLAQVAPAEYHVMCQLYQHKGLPPPLPITSSLSPRSWDIASCRAVDLRAYRLLI